MTPALAEIIERAPALTSEQAEQLRALLPPVKAPDATPVPVRRAS